MTKIYLDGNYVVADMLPTYRYEYSLNVKILKSVKGSDVFYTLSDEYTPRLTVNADDIVDESGNPYADFDAWRNTIQSNTDALTNAELRATPVPVSVSGGATSAKQDTGNTSLASIDGKTPALIANSTPFIATGSSYTFSTNNSSSVQLAAGATFTGTIEDVTNLPSISLLVTSDQNMTVTVLQYIDSAGTRLAGTTSFPIYAGVGFARSFPINGNYVQVTARNNGGSTTTTFRLDTAYGVIDASDASGFAPVQQAVRYAQGNITTQNLSPTGVATANSAVEIDLQGASQLAIQTTGTYTGALSLQVTNDGLRWETVTTTLINNFIAGTWSATISSGTIGVFIVDVSSFYKARITALAAVTGTATVTLRANSVPMTGVTKPIPSGTNAIGAVTQSGTWTMQMGNTPNTTAILANPLIPAVTTTGDTGAKTATGNGATQTNTTGKGALITFNLGTVSGITPTCVFKIQGSADGGTTWVDIPSANTASITATGAYGILINKGIASVAGVATAGTCAQVNSQLPRTWRVVWTIGGTTPSFTITNIQVSYLF